MLRGKQFIISYALQELYAIFGMRLLEAADYKVKF